MISRSVVVSTSSRFLNDCSEDIEGSVMLILQFFSLSDGCYYEYC